MSAQLQQAVNAVPNGSGPAQPFDAANLPGHVGQAIWRGNDIGQSDHGVVATGFTALDAELPGGGWPCNDLTELLQLSCELYFRGQLALIVHHNKSRSGWPSLAEVAPQTFNRLCS